MSPTPASDAESISNARAIPGPPAGVHHLAIQVRDLAATEAFYSGLLALPVLRRWPRNDGGSGERSVWLDLGGGSFLALERMFAAPESASDRAESGPGEGLGLHLFALRIDRAARGSWEARLAAAGVPVFHRTAHTLYVRDPEGNRIALSHWPEAAG